VTTLDTRTEIESDDLAAGGRHRLHEPGGRGGLIEVVRHRTVLSMLARRDVRVRYRYSSLGFAWAYVKPTIQFLVYYFIIGVVLGLDRRVENFAVYVFSGLCLLFFFNETIANATRSIVKNRAIVKKIWLPRQVFPIAGVIVAASRFVPQFLILMIGATATGWYFTWTGLAAAVAGVGVVVVWGLALGLLLSAVNVYLREVQNFLELTGFLTHWLTPMIKPWTLVASRLVPDLGLVGVMLLTAYLWNPLTTAVELFHLAFWSPTVDFYFELSPYLWTRAYVFFGLGVVVLAGSQWLFKRLQVRFAEEL